MSSPDGVAQAGANAEGQHGGSVPVLTIFLMTLCMSAMSGCGALPYFFTGKLQQSWAGIANAVACGVMLAASFDLLHEGAPYSPTLVMAGVLAGAIFVKLSQEYLDQFEDVGFHDLTGADARRALLIVGVMAAHAFGEGSGVGVSFSGRRGHAQGTLVTIAIGLHNVPEGMAVATVMMAKGGTAKRALFWSLLCSMPQALVAVPSYLFVETFQALLPLALGFAAGSMIWIVCAELLPDALESTSHSNVATAVTFSAAWLQGLSMWVATLEQPGGHLASPIRANLRALASHLLHLAAALAAAPCAVTVLFNLSRLPLPPRLTVAMAAGAMLAMGGADLLAVTASSAGLTQGLLLGCVGVGLAALALKRPHVNQGQKSQPPSNAPSPKASAAHPALLANGNPFAPGKPGYPSLLNASPTAAVANERAEAAAAMHVGGGALAKCGAAELNGYEGTWANRIHGLGAHAAPHPGTHVIDLTGTRGCGGVFGGKVAEGGVAGAGIPLPNVHHSGKVQGVGTMRAREGDCVRGMPALRCHAHDVGTPGPGWATDSVCCGGSACSHQAWGAEDWARQRGPKGRRPWGLEEKLGDGDCHPTIRKGEGSLLGGVGGLGGLDSGLQGGDDAGSALVRVSVGGLALLVGHAACSTGAGIARAVMLQQARSEEAGIVHLLLPLVLQGLPMALACLGLGTCWAMSLVPWGLYTSSSNSRAQQQGCSAAVGGAISCAAAVVLVAGGCMAMVPLGVHAAQGKEGPYDPAHWTDRSRAVASGALIWGALKLFWCSSGLSTRQPSRQGLLLGAGLGTGVVLTQLGLCQATPYCWALH